MIWSVILELKDIVELLSTSSFTTEVLCFRQTKIWSLAVAFGSISGHWITSAAPYLKRYPMVIKNHFSHKTSTNASILFRDAYYFQTKHWDRTCFSCVCHHRGCYRQMFIGLDVVSHPLHSRQEFGAILLICVVDRSGVCNTWLQSRMLSDMTSQAAGTSQLEEE